MPTYKSVPQEGQVVMGTDGPGIYLSVPYSSSPSNNSSTLVQRDSNGRIVTSNTLDSYDNNEVLNYYNLTQNFADLSDFVNSQASITDLQNAQINHHIIDYQNLEMSDAATLANFADQTINQPSKHLWHTVFTDETTNNQYFLPTIVEKTNTTFVFKARYETMFAHCCKIVEIMPSTSNITKYDIIESMTINTSITPDSAIFDVYNNDLIKLYNTVRNLITYGVKLFALPQLSVYSQNYSGALNIENASNQVKLCGTVFLYSEIPDAPLNPRNLIYVIEQNGYDNKYEYDVIIS